MLEFSGKEFQRASIKLLSWATMHIIETNEKLKDSERRYKKGTEIPEQNNIQNKKLDLWVKLQNGGEPKKFSENEDITKEITQSE